MADLLSIPPSVGVEFGAGAIERLAAVVRATGLDRAFVVTDPGLRAAGILDRVLAALAGLPTAVFDEVEPNPSTDTVAAAARSLREFGAAAVIALGGGSSMDVAKGAALAVASPPIVAVPTTAGSGAETNGFGVIEDRAARRKVYVGDASVTPAVAVLDPELTVGLPPGPTAATGFDALVHAIESLTSRGANPLSAAYAHQAVRLIHPALPAAVRDGRDLDARSRMLLGAHLAGRALTLSGLGLVHGIAHAVTAHTGAVHGSALASVCDRVVAFNGADRYDAVAPDLGLAQGRSVAAATRAFAEQTGAFVPLRELGVTEALVPAVAAAAVADAVTANNPRRPDRAEVERLVAAAAAE